MTTTLDEDVALGTFVGTHFAYYRRQWRAAAQRNGMSWNWAAFLFGPFWLAYRRMYWQVGVFAVAISALPVAEALLDRHVPHLISLPMLYAIAVVLGMYGNQFYKWHADATIRRLRDYHWSADTVTDSLARCGGTSWTGVAGMAALLFMVVVSLRPLARLAV